MRTEYKNQNIEQIINSRLFLKEFKNKKKRIIKCVFIIDSLKVF